MFLLITLLFVKHFIFDFLYQPPYQWQNKGTYGHLGGIVHSSQHAFSTFFILVYFTNFFNAFSISLLEFIIHYHTDWFKMKYNKIKGWSANTHNEFWILLGLDQLVHSLTYILITFLTLRGI